MVRGQCFHKNNKIKKFGIQSEQKLTSVKGELRGKNEVILDVWPWNHVSIFDNFIY